MPGLGLLRRQVRTEDIGPDRHHRLVDFLTVHLGEAEIGIENGVEKRADLYAGLEPAAVTARLGLHQVYAEIASAIGQRFKNVRWNKMSVHIDGHVAGPLSKDRVSVPAAGRG